jgi:hypothetical protein
LKVNETSGEQAGVSVSPIYLQMSTNFVMTFDMWLNYNSGNFPNGSTQVGSYGIAANSTTATWAGVGNGQLFGEVTDNGSIVDYRGYNNGVTIGAVPFVAGQNETAAYYTNLFPSVAVPAAETTLDFNQYGNSDPGTVSFQWVQVNVTYYNGLLSEFINGHLIASYTNYSIGSAVFLGLYDINNGSAGTNGLGDQNYVLFDNVQVESIPAGVYTFGIISGSPTNTGAADGPDTGSLLNHPRGTAVDLNYTVFVSDTGNNKIRKIVDNATNWITTTIAGTNFSGSTDGTNGRALFNSPGGISVDAFDNIYVADTLNNKIRLISPLGTNWMVTTIAGTNSPGSGNGMNGLAQFDNPYSVALDSVGNLYVADTLNETIRKIVHSGTNWIVSTIAGLAGMPGTNDGTSSLSRFNSPEGIAVDTFGNVYVADTASDTIRKLTPAGTNWVVTTIAGLPRFTGSTDGDGGNARFFNPAGLAIDNAGSLYVADTGNDTIRKIIRSGTYWTVGTIGGSVGVAGNSSGTGTRALFTSAAGVAIDGLGTLYVADGASGSTESAGIPALSGGVDLLGENYNYAAGAVTYYYVTVNLGPSAAVAVGGTWTLACHASLRLSLAGSTEQFSTTNMAMEFAQINGWNVPTSQTINVPPESTMFYSITTNLNYTVVSPLLSISQSGELMLTGTPGTTYVIQSSSSLLGPWSTLPGFGNFELTTSPREIEQISPWPSIGAPDTYYRAEWSGN